MSSTETPIPVAPPPVSPPGRPATPPAPAPPKAPPKPVLTLRWPLILLLVVLAGLSIGGYTVVRGWMQPAEARDIQLFTVTPRSFPVILEEKGELKAANSIEIRSEVEGKATIISIIDEGKYVKKGDLLVEMASDTIDTNIRDTEIKEANALAAYEAARKEYEILQDENASKIRKAELALQLAQLGYDKYKSGESMELRQTAELALAKARSVLERAQSDLKDSEDLFKQGFITRIELENDKFEAYEAELELQKAQTALEVLEKYTIPMALREKSSDVTEAEKELDRTRKAAAASEAKAQADVAGKKSELDLVREKLAKYRDQKAKARIVAPADGLVVYARPDRWWRDDNQIQKGTQVFERQSLIELPDTSSMKVVIRVHEAQTEHLKLGLPATVQIEGFSGRTFSGSISKIAVLADSQNRWLNPNLKEYETEILLDGNFKDLKPGITARAQVQIAQLSRVLAVPLQAVFGKGSRYFVFVDNNGTVEAREVRVGMSSSEYVEIKKGLSEGENVRLAVTEQMKLLLPSDDKEGGGEDRSAEGRRNRGAAKQESEKPAQQEKPASRPAKAA